MLLQVVSFPLIESSASLTLPLFKDPYFTYLVGDDDGRKGKFVPWGTAPECLQRAKDLMNNQGRKYGKRTAIELDIRRLEVRAWVTAGSKRVSLSLMIEIIFKLHTYLNE